MEKNKEIEEKGVWIVYNLGANRKIQEMLQKEGYMFRFDPSLKIIRRGIIKSVKKRIDDVWGDLTFDLHTRFCKILDVDGRTQKMCIRFREGVKEELKRLIK